MTIIKLRRNTSARRNMSVNKSDELVSKKPMHKSLLVSKKRTSGRNNQGRITVRHRGGGAKSKIRLVDYRLTNVSSYQVLAKEYDPRRSGYLAAAITDKQQPTYVPFIEGMEIGKTYQVGETVEVAIGNRCQLLNIPVGENVSCIQLSIGKAASAVRSAGSKAQLMAKDNGYALIKMPSNEVRRVDLRCFATIGEISNSQHNIEKIGSAGRKRHMGIRPSVRGKVMNPVDHPHGGGEGRQSIGMKHPKTPWGRAALGVKTRKNKQTNTMIVRDRRIKK